MLSSSYPTQQRKARGRRRRRQWFHDLAPDVADVETLGLSFSVCRKILVNLDLPHLANCMLVCKEWRSLIETCTFWAYYRRRHYGDHVVQPPTTCFLSEWNYVRVGTGSRGGHLGHVVPEWTRGDDDDSLFYPFPQLWNCGIVVPYKLIPPDGTIDMYHSFLFAAHWLESLVPVLSEFKLDYQAGVCLFRWTQPRMPTAKEVLDIFNVNPYIVQHTKEVRDFNRYEIGTYLQVQPFKGMDPSFLHWMIRKCGDRVLAFQVKEELVSPSPGFLLTHLSTGWVGGIIFASR